MYSRFFASKVIQETAKRAFSTSIPKVVPKAFNFSSLMTNPAVMTAAIGAIVTGFGLLKMKLREMQLEERKEILKDREEIKELRMKK